MRPDEKVLVANFAVFQERGKIQIDYPVQHAMIFYLAEKGFKFSTYNFVTTTWPVLGSGPLSHRLEQDIDTLVTQGLLETTSPLISITDVGIKEAKPLVQTLEDEGESYKALRNAVKEVLTSDPRIFLEKCYVMYIRKEYLLAKG